MNEEDEKKDPEQELKEELERYERQNQEAYDEETKANEELKRRQEERKKKGFLDEGSAFRTTAAIGTEVGLNTLLDLFSFEPGSQIAGGSAINYLAQRIRGGEFSKGEMIASGLASLIPGGAQGTALARTAKGIGKGAVSGAIETTGMTTIDEGRLPTAEELATGAGIGGAFGGLFTTAANTQQIKELAQRIRTGTGNIVDSLTPGPVRIMQGDLIGAAFTGGTSGTGGTIRQNQLVFDWEGDPNAANIPQAKTGGLFRILPRITRRAKNQVTRPGGIFQKPDTIDITNGFKTTRRHRNFEEFIEDLMEADRIPAKNIDRAGFRSSSIRQNKYGVEIDLYQDYLQGYFNTYDTLDGAMKLTIGSKPIKLGQSAMGAKSVENLTEINKLFRAYKLNPQSFDSGAFAPGSKTSANLLKEFADSKDLDDFLTKNTQLQRHHLLIIDDSFALVKGLTGNDLSAMRRAMNQLGLIAGNDPENLKFVPQKLHQKFVHGQVWKVFGPEWTGTSAKAKQLRQQISQLPLKDRIPFLNQLKEAVDLTNQIIDDAVDEYLVTKVAGFEISLADKADFEEFMEKLVERNKKQIGREFKYGEELIDITQPTTVKSTGKPTDKLDTETESDIFGQGQMQDDL